MKKLHAAITALSTFSCFVIGSATASTVAHPRLNIQEQYFRADYALQARVVEIKRLGKVAPKMPVGPCGISVKVSVIEQFKGIALPNSTSFVTYRVLFIDKPLQKGDVVLVLLRDLKQDHSGMFKEEIATAHARARACTPTAPSLYLPMYEEAIFPIVSETSGAVWLEYDYGGSTEIPRSIGPKREGVCEPMQGGGCVVVKHSAVAWTSLRAELKSWSHK